MLVSDVMRSQVFSVGPDSTVFEVAKVIMARNVQNVVVQENGRLVGIVGWSDLLSAVLPGTDILMQAEQVPDFGALVAMAKEHSHVEVRKVMHPVVSVTTPDTSASRALVLMLASHVPFLPVVDASRKFVGMLTLRELLNAFFFPDTPRAAGHS